ncbi:alpha/beta hydrolase [Pedobacter punctiformis]|uniref:Alpha/beta hydrolase-fold protein n=1 Tax=Pedobacter punctiformis TaxID=3004097 RepID=A0ABT4L4Y4_9SPHI|nr:alpha/beta hydrolase-fold protein [Pedobacter sp. HCMS5-2]MCZ4242975.1 alpha/beta hydrolase-fold protein [Pedobacter sp. HCMS5-2]
MYNTILSVKVNTVSYKVPSAYLKREVEIDIYVPEGILGNEKIELLLLNDGQDVAKMDFTTILEEAHLQKRNNRLIVVAIKASTERLMEYGVASVPDFKGRGAKADLYTDFIIKELLPFVKKKIAMPVTGKVAFAGFSLGGLSAFDIAWNNPNVFDVVGVFSGAFWWRKKDLADGYTDADRIMHSLIDHTSTKPEMKFWLMTGTEDEKADRNKNMIIDSIDDTIDIVKALLKKGYKRPENVFYYEKVGGKHDVPTWESAMPAFLNWAFEG